MAENGHSPQRAIDDDDDDDIQLSAETMAILGEFLIEKEQRECRKSADNCQLDFEEDWVGWQFLESNAFRRARLFRLLRFFSDHCSN